MKRLIKSLLFSKGVKPRAVLFGAGRGLMILVDPAVQSQRLLGLAEREVSGHFVEFAKRCGTFCDVGASDGWYCLLAGKYNPGAAIVAFEPDRELGVVATEHFRLNAMAERRIEWRTAFCGTRKIPLDEALGAAAEPIFIKMDIEGAELDALRSGAETIARKNCLLLVETHGLELERQCLHWLQDLGYTVRVIPKAGYRRFVAERRPLAHNQWFVAWREVPPAKA